MVSWNLGHWFYNIMKLYGARAFGVSGSLALPCHHQGRWVKKHLTVPGRSGTTGSSTVALKACNHVIGSHSLLKPGSDLCQPFEQLCRPLLLPHWTLHLPASSSPDPALFLIPALLQTCSSVLAPTLLLLNAWSLPLSGSCPFPLLWGSAPSPGSDLQPWLFTLAQPFGLGIRYLSQLQSSALIASPDSGSTSWLWYLAVDSGSDPCFRSPVWMPALTTRPVSCSHQLARLPISQLLTHTRGIWILMKTHGFQVTMGRSQPLFLINILNVWSLLMPIDWKM